uniref:Uncharacterized protein n=1 Tax=Streptomyces sp. ML694-90F3 TaxID=1265536 RepID=A0A077KUX3_9ACTN|nr:hypothetical protein [Streptomyces sp. ML694-90F3]
MHSTRVTGGYAITPPLPPDLTLGSVFHPDTPESPPYGCDLILRLDETDGPRAEATASRLEARRGDTYALAGQVQVALNTFPGHAFTGLLICEGNSPETLWRITVRDGRTVVHHARITWPGDDAPGDEAPVSEMP